MAPVMSEKNEESFKDGHRCVGRRENGARGGSSPPLPKPLSLFVQAVQKKEEIWKQGKYETNNFSVLA